MSQDADRIAVPTNGRGPHPAGPAATPPGPSAPTAGPDDVPSDEELATAFSPAGSPSGSGSSRRWCCCSPAGRAGAGRAAESMPVEPPVTSPRSSRGRLRRPGRGADPADRGRHGPDGRADRRARRAAGADPRPVAARRAARHRRRRGRRHHRRPDDLHGDPPLERLSRAPAGPGRGGRHDRRGPDPEPRHARRQRRERLAGRRHPAGPAGGRRVVRARLGAWRADGRGRATSGRPTGGPPWRRTSSCCGSGSR